MLRFVLLTTLCDAWQARHCSAAARVARGRLTSVASAPICRRFALRQSSRRDPQRFLSERLFADAVAIACVPKEAHLPRVVSGCIRAIATALPCHCSCDLSFAISCSSTQNASTLRAGRFAILAKSPNSLRVWYSSRKREAFAGNQRFRARRNRNSVARPDGPRLSR